MRPPSWSPGSRRVLLNLSGGVDSTYAAWRLLSEGVRVVIHHCRLTNREGRADVEAKAVAEIVAWLRASGLGGFEYVESAFDYGTLPGMVYDVELIGALTGVVLRASRYRSITTVVVAANAGDPTARSATSARGVRRRQLAETMAGRPLDWWWPIRDRTKAQLVADLPAGLLERCWWCRRPRDLEPCHRCASCREMDALGQVRALRSARTRRQELAG